MDEAIAEILAIDPEATVTRASECPGLREDYAWAEYDGGVGLTIEGPVLRVAAILKFAAGRI